MTLFFTGDHHFSHFNILRYTGRPFATVIEMDRIMVERWNERVKSRDSVMHLGDISFGRYPQIAHNVGKLNGQIWIIKGNHDKAKDLDQLVKDKLIDGWEREKKEWTAPDGSVWYLAHHPLPGEHRQLCGHVHQHWAIQGWKVNCGVDAWQFRPITIEEIQEKIREEHASWMS